MAFFGRDRKQPPQDSPDLNLVMAFVCAVGGLSAYAKMKSVSGLVTGMTLGTVFAVGGWWVTTNNSEKHRIAHQMSLLGSVLFAGAMGYRASANPYAGPGGNMLAALGGISSAYHLTKMLEWEWYEQERVKAAARLLEQYEHRSEGGGLYDATPAVAPNSVATDDDLGIPFPDREPRRRPPPGGF